MATFILTLVDLILKIIDYLRGHKCELTRRAVRIGGVVVAVGISLIAAAQCGLVLWPWLLR